MRGRRLNSADWIAALRSAGKPLVYTVHDLRNPHHHDPDVHERQLDVLIPAADAVITLTDGAARCIARRWGRSATVLPHPHVVPEPLLHRRRSRSGADSFVVGIHVKSLRPCMDPVPIVSVALAAAADLPGATVRVNAHRDVMEPWSSRYAPELANQLHLAAGEGLLQLQVHDYFTDDELWEYLQGLDVSILPYRFGTHSGWLEACYDLGTTVIAPTCGFYREQRPCLDFGFDEDHFDEQSLVEAVRRAYALRPVYRAHPPDRLAERRQLATAHRALYGQLLARKSPMSSRCG